jgi:hypothetical protein
MVAGPMSAGNDEAAPLGERDRRYNSIDVGSRKKVAAQIPSDGRPVGQPYEWGVPGDHLEVSAEDRSDQVWCLFGIESGGWVAVGEFGIVVSGTGAGKELPVRP